MRVFGPILLLLALMLAGCGEAREFSLRIGSLTRARLATLEPVPGPLLEYPAAIVVWRDSLAILDAGTPEIAILPTSLQGGRAFGREGRGPGELRGPVSLLPQGDSLLLYDRGNGQLTAFDPDGRVLAARPLSIGSFNGTLLPLADGKVLHPIVDPDYYLAVDSSGREVAKWGPRPSGLPPWPNTVLAQDFVFKSQSDVFVIDAHNVAAVLIESPDSVVVSRPSAEIVDVAMRRADSLTTPSVALDPIPRASASDEGILVWFLGRQDPCGALIDESGQWIPITGAEAHEDFPEWPLGVLYWESELYVFDRDGIRVYSVERIRS